MGDQDNCLHDREVYAFIGWITTILAYGKDDESSKQSRGGVTTLQLPPTVCLEDPRSVFSINARNKWAWWAVVMNLHRRRGGGC